MIQRRAFLKGSLAALGALAAPAWAQTTNTIEAELGLITPVSKFIHDAALAEFEKYAKERWKISVKTSALAAGTPVAYGRIVEGKGRPEGEFFWGGETRQRTRENEGENQGTGCRHARGGRAYCRMERPAGSGYFLGWRKRAVRQARRTKTDCTAELTQGSDRRDTGDYRQAQTDLSQGSQGLLDRHCTGTVRSGVSPETTATSRRATPQCRARSAQSEPARPCGAVCAQPLQQQSRHLRSHPAKVWRRQRLGVAETFGCQYGVVYRPQPRRTVGGRQGRIRRRL